jgi:hypothetical protein
VSDSVYSFRAGPTYRGVSRQELFDSAMEQPLSLTSTFFDQAKGGMLESYGLGTAIRDMAIPEGAATTETTTRSALRLMNPLTAGYESTRLAVQAFREESPVLDETKYKASPYYRENIPWDAGMTEARAKALSEWDDAKKVRQFYAQKRPISSFLGNLTGQAFDPINYVPVGGPLVRAAAVARAGRIGGAVVTGAVDAATNTALAGLATRETRQRFGDDVSFQAMVSEIATAALIGSAFGGISGALEARTAARTLADAQRSLSTLKTTQEARIALNESIDAVVRGEDIRLSPNATEAVQRLGAEAPANVLPDMAPVDPALAPVDPDFAKAALVQSAYDLKAVRASGQDVDAIMRSAPVEDAARAVQVQEIASLEARLAEFASETPVQNTYGPGLRRNELIPPDDMVFESGMGSAVSGPERAAEVAIVADRLAGLKSLETKQKVAQEFVDAIEFGRRTFPVRTASIDTAAARPAAPPEGRAQAEARAAKPDNYKALSEQYRVDPETGDFAESVEIEQMRAAGRLTDADIAELDAAQATLDDAKAYGEALKTVVGCLV